MPPKFTQQKNNKRKNSHTKRVWKKVTQLFSLLLVFDEFTCYFICLYMLFKYGNELIYIPKTPSPAHAHIFIHICSINNKTTPMLMTIMMLILFLYNFIHSQTHNPLFNFFLFESFEWLVLVFLPADFSNQGN